MKRNNNSEKKLNVKTVNHNSGILLVEKTFNGRNIVNYNGNIEMIIK